MDNKVTFDRKPDGTFTPKVETPQPGAGAGEAAAFMALGAIVMMAAEAGWNWLFPAKERV